MKLQRISEAIQRCSDRHQLNLLNKAWWAEFFSKGYNQEQLLRRMRELRIGTKNG